MSLQVTLRFLYRVQLRRARQQVDQAHIRRRRHARTHMSASPLPLQHPVAAWGRLTGESLRNGFATAMYKSGVIRSAASPCAPGHASASLAGRSGLVIMLDLIHPAWCAPATAWL